MKKLLFLLASSAVLLSSCEDVSTGVLDDGASEVTFKGAITTETRVADNLFEANDEIYVTAFDGESTFADKVSYIYNESIFSSTTPISYESQSQTLSFIAAYPAVSNLAKSFTFEVHADQNVDDNYEMSDLLIAKTDAVYDLCPTLVFNHTLSNLVIGITDADLRGGVLTIYAVGESTIDVENQAYTAVDGASDIAITAAYDTTYKAILSPQSISAGDVIATYEVNGATYTWNAGSNITLESGYRYIYSWDIENNEVQLLGTIDDWMDGGDFDIYWGVDDDEESVEPTGDIDDWADGDEFTISPMEASEFTLDYFSETTYPSANNWVITDASATTTDFAGLSAAIVALSGSGREISLEFPNLASIPNYAIFGESSFNDDLAIDALVSVSAAKATSVGQYAFYSCDALADVDFPAATVINTYAFAYTSITSICFPAATTLNNHCYRGCSLLVYAEFPVVTTINQYVLNSCSLLTELHWATADGVRLTSMNASVIKWATNNISTMTDINLTVGSANADMVVGSSLFFGDYEYIFKSITVLE
ncbi:MAG: fimbrillin family protein [Rikenellaceae bacterium]